MTNTYSLFMRSIEELFNPKNGIVGIDYDAHNLSLLHGEYTTMASVLPLKQSIRSPRFQEADEYKKINEWTQYMILRSIQVIVGITLIYLLPRSMFARPHGSDSDLLNAPNVFTPRVVSRIMIDVHAEEPNMIQTPE